MSTLSDSAVAGGSASAIYCETVTGWHVLKVEGYSKFKGIGVGVGQPVRSRNFTVGGHSWSIQFFPNGFSRETADWISVELHLNYFPADHDVKTSFTLSLLDQSGGAPVESYSRSVEYTFTVSPVKRSYKFRQFISKEVLESSFLQNDSFEIRCDITIAQVILTRVIPMESTSVTPPMTDLQNHLGDLLAGNVGGDVTFEVNGEQFTAHRYILAARSPVFMVELFGPMKQKKHIRIKDMEARVFKIMLQFIYTDTLHMREIESDERTVIAQHLFVAADLYSLQKLKLICEGILCNSVDIRTAATTLVLAEQHACQGLKVACLKFLKRPGILMAVMATDGFQHLKSSCPSLVQTITTRI